MLSRCGVQHMRGLYQARTSLGSWRACLANQQVSEQMYRQVGSLPLHRHALTRPASAEAMPGPAGKNLPRSQAASGGDPIRSTLVPHMCHMAHA